MEILQLEKCCQVEVIAREIAGKMADLISCVCYLGMLSLLPMTFAGYKEEHSGFVKNFKGTSAGYVIVCLLHVPASILLLKIVQGSSRPSFIRDFFCLIVPILLNMTLLSNWAYVTIIILILFEAFWILRINPYRARKESDDVREEHSSGSSVPVGRCKKAAYLDLFKGRSAEAGVI